MDQSEIKQLLKASGKDFFVKYYLDMRSDTDAKALKQLLLSSEDYTKQSINTRVSKSRKVISSGYGLQA